MTTPEYIKSEYPLHWLVWNNLFKELQDELAKNIHDKEKKDNRGRSPLMLAVTLGHLESVRILLQYDTNVNCENSEGWTAVQEAVATGDPELLALVLERRDFQRYSSRVAGIPELLQRLKQAPDFYVEMKWEFTSWVPLVSRMCPSDTYKVYKQGSNVRIDTTLLGFDHTSWQRGNRSYIFKGQNDGATMMEVDHETKQVYIEAMRVAEAEGLLLTPPEQAVEQRLTTPLSTTYIDTDKISFERNKAGIWGWRSDKTETVNGFDCKVFSATNVELITKTRTEHLTDTDKAKAKQPKTPLQSFLGIAEIEEKSMVNANSNEEYTHSGNPCNITPEEYFDINCDLDGRDIGRPKEVNTKIQKFKATLWLSENYPLSLQEQIMPIVDLMAISSSHFAKLKDFIQMQLPAGFPVKIEIPLFHVLNARITFGNIFGMDNEIPNVSRIEENERITCVVDDSCFNIPVGYNHLGADTRRQFSIEEEDDLLQYAIQQSLIEVGSEKDEVDIWEALKAQRPSRPTTPNIVTEEERQLQRAIQASLGLTGDLRLENNSNVNTDSSNSPDTTHHNSEDADLHMALMLSKQERDHDEQERLKEQQMLEEVLRLSLTDK